MIQFIIQFIERIKSGSPVFFIKLRKGMVILGALIVCVQALLHIGIFHVDMAMLKVFNGICTQALVVLGTVTGVSFLPTADPRLMDEQTKQNVIQHEVQQHACPFKNNENKCDWMDII